MLSLPSFIRHSLLLFSLFALLAPIATSAQLVDPRCFTKAECAAAREGLGVPRNEVNEGFYIGRDAISECGTLIEGDEEKQLGFCLPAGKTNTAISFGGRNQFDHLGDFISFMYRYGVQIAGIVAVIVIILSGFQWAVSGGNASTIDSAKKRISGAIVGLLLAVFAYTILNTINPYLVNLRLPQIWLVKSQSLTADYCDVLPTSTKKVAVFQKTGEDVTSKDKEEAFHKANFSANSEFGPPPKGAFEPHKAPCGWDYFVPGENGSTCQGVACSANQVCLKTEENRQPHCVRANLAGQIKHTGAAFFSAAGLQSNNLIDDAMILVAVCGNGTTKEVADFEARQVSGENEQFYTFHTGSTGSVCSGEGPTIGFYIAAEVNDEGTFGAGSDDWFAIGRQPTENGKHTCNVNLSKVLHDVLDKEIDCSTDSESPSCSCEGFANEYADISDFTRPSVIQEIQKYLIGPRELHGDQNGTLKCDILLNRTEFPHLDYGTREGVCTNDEDF